MASRTHRPSTCSTSIASRTYYNKTFEDTTDLFLFACAHGDYMLVHRLLQEGEVKADVSNKMGKSALQLAIENEHFEVVKVLLDQIPYEKFRDALLLAIYLGHTNIADFILNHPIYLTFHGGFRDPIDPQAYDDSQFSSDITPLILAAQYNRLQIVHQLLSKGERIKKPHASMCPCIDCTESSASDSFRHAQVRLSAYKGLSSEVYIALVYPDPVLQAFQLSDELRTLAKVEHYFREDYQKLANQLSIFVTRLLDNVRGHEELEIVLNKTGLPNEEKYENLARFDLAIQYEEKPFVSHSNCQQKLMEKWYENLTPIKNAHLTKRLFFYLAFVIALPFLSLAFFFFPKSKIGSFCNQPNLKLKAYIASYLAFIGLIVASSYFSIFHLKTTKLLSEYNETIYRNYIEWIYLNEHFRNDTGKSEINCDISLRFMEPNPFQIAIFIWVIGFVWQEIKQIHRTGIRRYFVLQSNIVDCGMNILYVLYFICLYVSMLLTRTSINQFHSNAYWEEMENFHFLSEDDREALYSHTRHILYWLNADRYYWNSADAQNLAEAFFAMGNVASICRICFLLPIIGFVGPLQIMLERMIRDISKWLVIILIFFFAFACSLFLIFSYFAASLQQHRLIFDTSPPSLDLEWNSSIPSGARCPGLFFQMTNYSTVDLPSALGSHLTADKDEDFCVNTPHYDKISEVGPYPAISYFGDRFSATILTTFFTLFGVIAEDDVPDRGYELITLACNKPDSNTYREGFDLFTSNLGFIIYGLFSFICVTVLINTLIAMMEETIDTIDDRADVEWKFARSRLYMEYIREGNTLPVPMNICPSPQSIYQLLVRLARWIFARSSSSNADEHANARMNERLDDLNIRRGPNHNANISNNTQHDQFKNEGIFDRKHSLAFNEPLTYRIVIERIIKRFLLYYKNKHTGTDENNDGLEFKEFKNDISSLRFELLNELDMLDEMKTSLLDNVSKLNEDIRDSFDLDKVQTYLNDHQK